MDNSNKSRSSTGGTDHFFPTSTTHFLDPLGLPTFLDSSPATSSGWPPVPEQTNPPTCSIGAAASGPTPRPSKKRSRASRRAPTTVLTTDPSNFRAMVQEFTGIPAPPFASPASLHFPRSMFTPPPPPPSFLIKPGFANNFQPSASGPINFQSLLLQSQLLNLPQVPASAPVTVPSSGELSLPGVIGRQQQQQQVGPAGSCKLNFPAAGPGSMAEFRTEKGSEGGRGDGLLESWMRSSD